MMTVTLNTKAREIYINQRENNLLRVTEVKYFTTSTQQALTNVLLHQYYNTDNSIYLSTKEAPIGITDLHPSNVSVGKFTYKSVDVEHLQCEGLEIYQLRIVRELQFNDVDQCNQIKQQLENLELEINSISTYSADAKYRQYEKGYGLYLNPMSEKCKHSTIGEWV